MIQDIEKLCRRLDHEFTDSRLIGQALTHRSAGGDNNERLEYLGDAILGFVIADALFHRFPGASEGELSRLRSSLVKRDTLSDIAREYSLGDYLTLGSGELRSGGHMRSSILADGLEAIFAAIYLDGGYQKARDVILTVFSNRLKHLKIEDQQKDPKTRLQELLQSRKLNLPTYDVTKIKGDPHEQVFYVLCAVDELNQKIEGAGSSRRKAEQDAAARMLNILDHD
ncbi:MAG: ribonuclease III [Candidatus Thiodiazotropha sp. (ex Monitilora ramsayi)]|nr:ribonuclease III [Candidatus Thiodiazotropha sp. (ex Monitilora ramsayi)]